MNFTNKIQRRVAATGVALIAGGAIGVTVLGTSQAETTTPASAPTVAAAPASAAIAVPVAEVKVWAPKVTAYATTGSPADAATAQKTLEDSHLGSGADASKARTVSDPSGTSKSWTITPTTDGVCAVIESGHTLCAHDDRLAASGASVSWSVPSPVEEQAGTGTYSFRGIAVDDADTISVINAAGEVVGKTTPKGSIFSVSVPANAKPTGLRVSGGGKVSVIQVG